MVFLSYLKSDDWLNLQGLGVMRGKKEEGKNC